MICPKCDHNFLTKTGHTESCSFCGYSYDAKHPTHSADQAAALHRARMDEVKAFIVAEGLVTDEPDVKCLMPGCNTMVKVGAHYCVTHRNAIEANKSREWHRAHQTTRQASAGAQA